MGTWTALKQYGIHESLLDVVGALDNAVPQSARRFDCHSALAAYVKLRVG